MKARTKNQIRVVQLDKKIRPLGKRIIDWIRVNTIEFRGIRYKSGALFCLECGHEWKSDFKQAWMDIVGNHVCPSCNKELKIEGTQKRTDWTNNNFTYITTIGEYQLFRNFEVTATYRVRKEAEYKVREVGRVFLREDGKAEVIGCIRSGGWNAHWQWDMELRHPDRAFLEHNFQGVLYKSWKLQPWITKKGFNSCVYADSDYTVLSFMARLALSPHAETILKNGWENLFEYSISNRHIDWIEKHWRTIKVCMRNNFEIREPQSYVDMMNNLVFFNKNLEDPKFVCPPDFHKAHDYWDKRKQKVRAQEQKYAEWKRKKEQALKLKKQAKEYEERMKKFAKLELSFEDLTIVPMLKLKDVEKAGDLMGHCIFSSSSYWTYKDNILFATYKNGELIETTQYSINDKRCIHSYGKGNKVHDPRVVKTILRHRLLIDKCLKPKRKAKTKVEPQLETA